MSSGQVILHLVISYDFQLDVNNVQAKLKQLEKAVATHRESMREIEKLAFGNDLESQQNLNNDFIDENPKPIRPVQKFNGVDNPNPGAEDDLQQSQKFCTSSYGIDEAAKSNLNVRFTIKK